MIQSVSAFVDYFEGIRRRTMNYIKAIPADRVDWSPREGELTCGDIARHLAAGEKMFANVVAEGCWKYVGHDKKIAGSLDEILVYLHACHVESMNVLRAVDDAQLNAPRPSLKGPPVKAWRWLMAMVEHEVHHRSQLAVYLTLMGVEPPQIYGLTIEDIVAMTTG